MGDSYYEYLLKQWLQTGKKEDKFKNQWILAMNEMHEKLVRCPSVSQSSPLAFPRSCEARARCRMRRDP